MPSSAFPLSASAQPRTTDARRAIEREALFGRERDHCFRLVSGALPVPEELTEYASRAEGHDRRVGMGQLARIGEHLAAPRQSLLWVTENEQDVRQRRQTHHA